MVLSGSIRDADDVVMNNLMEIVESIEFFVGPVADLVTSTTEV